MTVSLFGCKKNTGYARCSMGWHRRHMVQHGMLSELPQRLHCPSVLHLQVLGPQSELWKGIRRCIRCHPMSTSEKALVPIIRWQFSADASDCLRPVPASCTPRERSLNRWICWRNAWSLSSKRIEVVMDENFTQNGQFPQVLHRFCWFFESFHQPTSSAWGIPVAGGVPNHGLGNMERSGAAEILICQATTSREVLTAWGSQVATHKTSK